MNQTSQTWLISVHSWDGSWNDLDCQTCWHTDPVLMKHTHVHYRLKVILLLEFHWWIFNKGSLSSIEDFEGMIMLIIFPRLFGIVGVYLKIMKYKFFSHFQLITIISFKNDFYQTIIRCYPAGVKDYRSVLVNNAFTL